jgi:hypothetical protein
MALGSAGGRMTKRSRRESPPPTFVPTPYVSNVHRPGDKGIADPFYQFENRAQPGRPAPVSKRELQFDALLGSNAALTVMGCLLAAVLVVLLVLLVSMV